MVVCKVFLLLELAALLGGGTLDLTLLIQVAIGSHSACLFLDGGPDLLLLLMISE